MTLLSIHNEHFIIKLVDDIRLSIEDGSFMKFKKSWLSALLLVHSHSDNFRVVNLFLIFGWYTWRGWSQESECPRVNVFG